MNRVQCLTLLGAWLSLGILTACRDTVAPPVEPEWTKGVVITPPSANLNVGDRLTFVASVFTGPGLSRKATWATANTSVATVNATTGEVTAVGTGTTNITATSAADTTLKAAAAVTVGSILEVVRISAINQGGKTADLSNISGRIDVIIVIPAAPPYYGTVNLFLNCGGTDTVVATQSVPTTVSGEQSDTLSFNTATFKNGPCTLKVKATTSTGAIVSSSATPITLNNPSAAVTLLGAEYLRDPRLQRVQIFSQRLITLDGVVAHSLIHASSHAGEVGNLRL